MKLRAMVLVLCAACISGCGAESAGRPVSGNVTYHGEPLDQGSIEFWPQSQQPTFSGGPILEGKYAVSAEFGLAPGPYKVKISSIEGNSKPSADAAPGDTSGGRYKERIPAKYNEETTLEIDVKPEGDNKFDFQIP